MKDAFKVKKLGKYVLSEIVDKSNSLMVSQNGDETFETQPFGEASPKIKFEAYKSAQLIQKDS